MCAIYASDPAKGWRPWGALVPFLGVAFVAMTVASLTFALQHIRLVDANENPVGLVGFAVFLLLPFAALGLVVLAWVRFVERRPLASIGLTGGRATQTFALGLLTGVAMVTTMVAAIWLVGSLATDGIGPAFRSQAALGGIAVLLECFALQSSAEEILFRGWMLSAIAEKFGIVFAVVLSSLTFTFLHYDPATGWLFAANVFLFAVFACCWSISTGNIWGVMGWHAGWNWFFITGFELRTTGLDAHMPALIMKMVPRGPGYLTGGTEGPESSIMCTLLLTIAIAYLIPRARQRIRSAQSANPCQRR